VGTGSTGAAGSVLAAAEVAQQQMAQLRHGLEQSHKELHQAVAELGQERQLSRQRHAGLVECLTGTIQARDAALGALKRLEMFCHEHGWDIHDLAIYEV